MKSAKYPSSRGRLSCWPPSCLAAVLLSILVFSASFSSAGEDHSRLASGEIIVSLDRVQGSTAQRGQAMGVVDSPPAKVWQVITEVNHFQEFMPRTLRSITVTPEQLQEILKTRPTSAPQVEQILGSIQTNPQGYRLSGQKWTVYLYSLLDFPWPVSHRWYIIKISNDETQAGSNRYISSWSLQIGNLRENRGEWRLEPFGDQKTLVTYQLITDPDVSLPPFLVKRGTSITLPQVIASVRKRVTQLSP